MKQVQLVFVGGFLGVGKTTLLWRAAELLMKCGKRVGLITNDQAPGLADPLRLGDVLSDSAEALHADAAYVFRKQLEEADLLVIHKMDLVSREEQDRLGMALPHQHVGSVSLARTERCSVVKRARKSPVTHGVFCAGPD